MKTTLFLSFLLFITACSDSTTKKAATQSEPEAKEVTHEQEKPLVQQAPAEAEQTSVKAEPAPAEVESTPAEAAPVETAPAPATAEPATVAAKVSAKETSPVNGHALFAHQCASCHGTEAEKSALNTSKIIAGWEEEKILAALRGYKEGGYGGKLKAIMKGQVNGLNEEELKAVAAYISTL